MGLSTPPIISLQLQHQLRNLHWRGAHHLKTKTPSTRNKVANARERTPLTKSNKKFAGKIRLRKREQNAIGVAAEMLTKKREKQARKTMTIRPMT